MLETPAVEADEAIVERNLIRMAERVKARQLTLVPHIKTHKSPWWTARQIALGAPRVMVAKLSEATLLLDNGITDQFIGYPLIGDTKATRLVRLMELGLQPMVAVDSTMAVDLLARVGAETGRSIAALIEVDTGFGRCGLKDDADIVALARYMVSSAVEYRGITCFGGRINWRQGAQAIPALVAAEDQRLAACAAALERAGLAPAVISQGGTVIAGYMDELKTATELRPGIYLYNDVGTVAAGSARWEDCGAFVLTTVVSTPASDHAVVDAGSKTLAGDGPIHHSFGYLRERPDLRLAFLSEEHGVVVHRDGGPTGLRLGERLTVIPNHVCTMINLHDTVYLIRDGAVHASLPVLMRGAVR